jgi:hypothetical protein
VGWVVGGDRGSTFALHSKDEQASGLAIQPNRLSSYAPFRTKGRGENLERVVDLLNRTKIMNTLRG